MRCYIEFTKDSETSRWLTRAKGEIQYSLEEAKDLIDKAIFISSLNAHDTNSFFRLTISDKPFDHQLKLGLTGEEYHIIENVLFSGHGSFFPKMFHLFSSKPEILYMKVESSNDFNKSEVSKMSFNDRSIIPETSIDEFKKWNNHISPFE